jgi:hypothetical protein
VSVRRERWRRGFVEGESEAKPKQAKPKQRLFWCTTQHPQQRTVATRLASRCSFSAVTSLRARRARASRWMYSAAFSRRKCRSTFLAI